MSTLVLLAVGLVVYAVVAVWLCMGLNRRIHRRNLGARRSAPPARPRARTLHEVRADAMARLGEDADEVFPR